MTPILALAFVLAAAPPTPAVGPGECAVFAPLNGPEIVVGGDECSRRTLPASTFKIPHALVALQTHVVTDGTVIKWDGVTRDFPAWNRDQTLASAIRMSAVWVFQQFAVAIGRERELEHLRAFHYGSATFAHDVTNFWLNGDLEISPLEQITFLRRLFSYDLPVERRHIDTVKADLAMPRGKIVNAAGEHDFPLRWPADTIVRVKTGNGTVSGEHVSWIVGELESGGGQYLFAVRKRATALDMFAAADLAARVLNAFVPRQNGVPQACRMVAPRTSRKAVLAAYAPDDSPVLPMVSPAASR
ncbi:MAG: penicillin-binding transpeptidase domain-containing protein [Vicinamibacterales bacterium]